MAEVKKIRLMKRSTFSVLLLLLLLLCLSQAEPPPSLHDPFLDNLVGDWQVERKMGSGRTGQASVRCEWVLKHQFVEMHYGSAGAATEYEALVFIGFDDATKNYVCHWVDIFGGHYSAVGRGKMDDKLLAIEFRFEPKDGELTNKFTFDPKTKTWTSLIRQTEKGEWKTFAEEKWTKK
jgi:uncharacterized protein DUF1579